MSQFICKQCAVAIGEWANKCPACGSTQLFTLKPVVDPMEGRMVSGRYRILRKLGQGGMGAVYLAEQPELGNKVALKFLNANLSHDEAIARRFLNEARSYGLVAHPNAVALHDFGQDEQGNLFISMEYVEGEDLKKLLLREGRLAVSEAVDITLQLADVLAHAHAQQVVHRDLKPENVVVRRGLRGYHAKVLDFGIARILGDGATRVTAQGLVAGTPNYMAPEQVEGKDVDARVDIYALGLVFFELLTGQVAIGGTSVAEVLNKQFRQPTPSLAEVVPELNAPALDAIIQKATAKSLETRYASMEAFATDLKAAQGTGVLPPPAKRESGLTPSFGAQLLSHASPDAISETLLSPKVPQAKAGSRLGVGAAIAGTVVLLGLGAGAVVVAPRFRSPSPAPAAVAEAPPPKAELPPPVPTPAPPTPTPVAPPPEVKSSDVDDMRRHLLAEEVWARANAAFISGDMATAQALLETVPGVEKIQPKVAELRESLTDVSARLKRARAQADAGDCGAAIKTYNALLKRYPHVREAKRGRGECQAMLPVGVMSE
ncbi:protein kinase domain-containing protein [Archangium sp.]|uniref:serine/threonine-protein kinase n=1 Tax=Archangium sp. TaxID=1872627 RepID=UPI00286BB092|nr:protein kinase [Archangium sp.]